MYTDYEIEQAKTAALKDLLLPAKKRKGMFTCPDCGHETVGKPRGPLWRCFRCDAHGDAGNILRDYRGMGKVEAFMFLMDRFGGCSIDSRDSPPIDSMPDDLRTSEQIAAWKNASCQHCTSAVQAFAHSDGAAYMTRRAITEATCAKFYVGYDPKRRAVVLPYTAAFDYYETRCIDADGKGTRYMRPSKQKAGPMQVYNESALTRTDARAIIVVEGSIDCLSIAQTLTEMGIADVHSVAIGGARNHGRICKMLSDNPSRATILLMLDDDRTGQSSTLPLASKLRGAGRHVDMIDTAQAFCGRKDANELLVYDHIQLQGTLHAILFQDAFRKEQINYEH